MSNARDFMMLNLGSGEDEAEVEWEDVVVCVGITPCGIHTLLDWQIGSSHLASMGCNGGLRKIWPKSP